MKITPWRRRNEVGSYRGEFDDLMQRMFDDSGNVRWNLPESFRQATIPPVNIGETEKAWTISVELPGLEEKDIQVQIMGDQLVISGERKWESEKNSKDFHRVESQYGAFQRTIALPMNARTDPDAISATYKRGMLELTLPKVEPTPAAKIKVKAG